MKKQTSLKNRILSFLLVIAMILSLMPTNAIETNAAQQQTTTISVSEGNAPVVGALVTVARVDSDSEWQGKTGEDGTVEFTLESGSVYRYTVSKTGYDTKSGRFSYHATVNVSLQAKEEITVIGKVTNSSGIPLADVELAITGYAKYYARTGENGTFSLNVYEGESYSITATVNGYKSQTVTMNLDNQNVLVLEEKEEDPITFEKTEVEVAYGSTAYNQAKSANSQAVIQYVSNDTSIVTVADDGTITPTGIGSTTITATREEDETYLSASNSFKVTVVKGTQSDLTWTKSVPSSISWKETFTNTVEGGNSIEDPIYTSSDETIATVDAVTGTVTFLKPGTVTITATKASDTLYNEKTASYTITAGKAQQDTLAFVNPHPDAIIYGTTTFTNVAEGGSTSETVQYSSSDETVATVDANGTITTLKAGQVTITAVRSGNDYYEDVQAEYQITINKAAQTTQLTFASGNDVHTIVYGQGGFSNLASGGDGYGEITYTSSNTDVATVSPVGTVIAKKAGTTVITATKATDDKYLEQSISYTLVVEKASQGVTFKNGITDIPAITFGEEYENEASAMTAVTYSAFPEDIVMIDVDGTIRPKKAGTVTITATAAETDQYLSAFASYTITINKADQTIDFAKGKEHTVTFNDNNNQYVNTATALSNECVYSIASGAEFVKDGTFNEKTGEFEIAGAGEIIVSVAFSSDDCYNMVQDSYKLTVLKDSQQISFENDSATVYAGETVRDLVAKEEGTLFGTGTITYEIVSDADGVIQKLDTESGAVTMNDFCTGSAVIRATKAADANYEEAIAEYTLNVEFVKETADPYELDGTKTDNKNEWYISDVAIKARDQYQLSYDDGNWQEELRITQESDNNVAVFYAKNTATNQVSGPYTEIIKIDKTVPTASITVADNSNWTDKLLTILTLGMLNDQKEAEVTIEKEDATSDIAKVEYYVADRTTEVMEEKDLDAITTWLLEKDDSGFSIPSNKEYVVYAKVTDNAGKYIYAATNGIIADATPASISLSPTMQNANGTYNANVEVAIGVQDQEPSAGIQKVEYWVEANDVETQRETLFTFDNTNPTYEELKRTWNGNIIVNAEDNGGYDVKVFVQVTDNAGNVSNYTVPGEHGTTEEGLLLDIDVTPPRIDVTYDNNVAYKIASDRGYFPEERTATVVITERSDHFRGNNVQFVIEKDGEELSREAIEKMIEETWVTEKGATPNEDTHTLELKFAEDGNYTFDVSYVDDANNPNEEVDNGESITPKAFTIDKTAPTGTITIDESTWGELREKLTFGLWKNEKVDVSGTTSDVTSPIESVKYYKTSDIAPKTRQELDALEVDTWQDFDGFSVEMDEQFVVYLKITDFAGNYNYICSNGYIVDMTESVIELTPEAPNALGIYNADVEVAIKITDPETYSGIQKVEYWVEKDGVETQRKTLYHFDYQMNTEGGKLTITDWATGEEVITTYGEKEIPTYDMLKHEWTGKITVEAAKNDSSDVRVFVQVTDNAGNVVNYTVENAQGQEETGLPLDIDITTPAIRVRYNNDVVNKTVDGRGYFFAERTATIVITERANHFNPDSVTIEIQKDNKVLSDAEIATMFDDSYNNGEWLTQEGGTADKDIHTLKLKFAEDGNYTFNVSYVDNADNSNTEVNFGESTTPNTFTVDKTAPTGTITVAENTWSKLLETLTFGLWKNSKVDISGTSEDATSPLEKVMYYKTDRTTVMTKAELDNVAADKWQEFNGFTIEADEQFVVYLKITDFAGNYTYINSDGYVVDMTGSVIELTPEQPNKNGLYNKDVDVAIKVTDPEAYSGIQKVEYWVEKDGEETQRETLYYFDYQREENEDDLNTNGGTLTITDWATGEKVVTQYDAGKNPMQSVLKHEWTGNITVDAQANNSCNVRVYVQVTDNAGNVVDYTMAGANGTEQLGLPLEIDITVPKIEVTYDNNEAYKIVEGRGYFPAERIATVVVTERTHHFDSNKVKIVVTKDGETLSDATVRAMFDKSYNNGVWLTEEGTSADEATHTIKLKYAQDGNYTFDITYVDDADWNNTPVDYKDSVTPNVFTVDKTAPTGTVKVGELGLWDKLIESITFGLWSKDTVTVSGTSADVTSPIESVDYYKISGRTTIGETDTKAILKLLEELPESEWKEFEAFDVPASEQFVVYVRIVDNAGNTTYISTDGIIVDNVQPAIESIAPEITITPEQPYNGIYNTDVDVSVQVKELTVGDTYSGIKNIRYEVLNMGEVTQEGVLYNFEHERANLTQDKLLEDWNGSITVDKTKNNSNDVVIKVYASDNAGNDSQAEQAIQIDVTNPTITVVYDNNEGDTSFDTGVYFKANRTATITVQERNFDPERVDITVTNTDGTLPALSAWTKVTGTQKNGDDTVYVARLVYSADGDYTFNIACSDVAGNGNENVDYQDSLAPANFTIDKTVPTFAVSYDNNSATNGNYYKAQRVATVTVTEHNFETSRAEFVFTATDNGRGTTLPAVGRWSSNGDVHTVTISYTGDALYSFDFNYQDKAGNAMADIEEERFYVDKTNPQVSITPIVDNSANNDEGKIGFEITATDTNFDVFRPVLTAVVRENGEITTKTLDVGQIVSTANGQVYVVDNLDADGIYRITCTVVDKAGNAYSEVMLQNEAGNMYSESRSGEDTLLTFSVNREGSSYEIDSATKTLIDQYYVQNVEEDVTVIEINANPLVDYKVVLNEKELVEGRDYTVTQTGGAGSWHRYVYSINKSLFEEEGEYNLVVSSTDEAENNTFSDVKETTVRFVVDRTKPVVAITGMATDGRYQVESQKVTLIPTDDGGALNSLIVRLVDADGNVLEELINLAGEELQKALEEGEGKITFEIGEGLYQNVEIICNDCAVDGEGNTNTYKETFTNISVSTNAFMIFWANKPLRYGTIAGLIVLLAGIFFIIMGKRRKDKEEQ